MQAIEVKFIGPSYTLGDRVIAFCAAKRKVYAYNALEDVCVKRNIPMNRDNVAKLAAESLKNELGWELGSYGRMVMGSLKNGNYVFVFTGE
jgi:hypothetical protein